MACTTGGAWLLGGVMFMMSSFVGQPKNRASSDLIGTKAASFSRFLKNFVKNLPPNACAEFNGYPWIAALCWQRPLVQLHEVEKSMTVKLLPSRAKSRDPVRSAGLCKHLMHAMDPGSRPG